MFSGPHFDLNRFCLCNVRFGLKASRISEWLQEGHRVRVDLFLRGRYKYMEEKFLKNRIEQFLKLVTEDYKIADPIKKSPKGFSTTLERGKKPTGAEKTKVQNENK